MNVAAPHITEATELAELPVLIFDSETTGLDITHDDIISVGGVRMQGAQIVDDAPLDQLINPERPIPRLSTVIHGITDAMVADAPTFAEVWQPLIEPALQGRIVVGHNIGFDIAHLRRATSKIGLKWPGVRALDTLLLYASLEPKAPAASLDYLAAEFGVKAENRHTALGDCQTTAAVYQHLLARLHDKGVTTLGQAEEWSRKPKAIRNMQKRAGW